MNAAGQRRATPVLCALALVLGAVFVLLASGVGSAPHWDAPRAAASLTASARWTSWLLEGRCSMLSSTSWPTSLPTSTTNTDPSSSMSSVRARSKA